MGTGSFIDFFDMLLKLTLSVTVKRPMKMWFDSLIECFVCYVFWPNFVLRMPVTPNYDAIGTKLCGMDTSERKQNLIEPLTQSKNCSPGKYDQIFSSLSRQSTGSMSSDEMGRPEMAHMQQTTQA